MFYLDIQVSGRICYIGLYGFDPFVFTCNVGKQVKIIYYCCFYSKDLLTIFM